MALKGQKRLRSVPDDPTQLMLRTRLRDLVREAGGAAPFAEKAELSKNTLNKYLGGVQPSPMALARIADAANVTVDFLLGRGSSPDVTAPWSARETGEIDENVALVPLLDVVASAGPGIENTRPYEIERLPFPRSWLRRMGVPESAARFLDSRGDSMEPTIPEGAITLIDTRFHQARRDGIYVLIVGNDVRIKRIRLGWQGAIQLISDNERYEDEQLSAPEAEALRIAGKVVWAGGEV